jgi:hypothetical protein
LTTEKRPASMRPMEHDPYIAGLLEHKPGTEYRPIVLMPGDKPRVCPKTFNTFNQAQEWAAGYVRAPGNFIKLGTTVLIGDTVLTVQTQPSGFNRLLFLGKRRILPNEVK